MVVVGGQFGSEAKGHVAAKLVEREQAAGRHCTVVRVGGPNAGHTVLDRSGVAWPLRQVPVGAVFPEASLVIGAGSEVDADVLLSEITSLREGGHDVRGRMYVDAEATVLESGHKDIEGNVGLIGRVGSTGKGIGAARADRIMRRAATVGATPKLVNWLNDEGVRVVNNTARMLTQQLVNHAGSVVIEGTQGYGLGLHAGYYPYCTSNDCRAIDFLSQAGVSPWVAAETEVWITFRPFPIRVAGNSGPLRYETTWESLGLPEERTTVTKKVRRVGHWDGELARDAVLANGGRGVVKIAFSMADQVVPSIRGVSEQTEEVETKLRSWIDTVEASGAEVRLVTTSPSTGFFRYL